jgi:hypothetical protein
VKSLKLDFPNVFVEMLKSLEREMQPGRIIELLKWASENPAKAARVVEGYEKLKNSSQKEFQWSISIGNESDQALEYAEHWEKRRYEQLSLLRKVIANAKKGGHALRMPNGVQCTIQHKEAEYRFIFNVAGEEIILFYSRITCDAVEEAEKYGRISTRSLYTIVYKGKVYDSSSQTGRALIQSIEQNLNPKVAVVILAR